jgi:hypothetical protein
MASDPPNPAPPQRIVPLRAGVVMVIFLIGVAVLVAVGTRPSVSGDAAPPVTTTTIAASTGTTTSTTAPHDTVSVVVANGTNGVGVAGHFTTVIAGGGWSMKPATDATTSTVPTSAVYYASGQQEAAAAIATMLGLKPAAVLPLTTSVPVAGTAGIDVVVVIGADLVSTTGG